MTVKEKPTTSSVVKVTGMSPELIALLDARVREQHAAGRAEYVRELIRRDVLSKPVFPPEPLSESEIMAEYHVLSAREAGRGLSSAEQARLRELEEAMDRAEAQAPETIAMFARLEEAARKLDALLTAVQALPQAQAGE